MPPRGSPIRPRRLPRPALTGAKRAVRCATMPHPRGRTEVPPAVIQSKLAVPPLGERLAARPRVSGLIAELLARHPLVLVSATAGAGKTTAVVPRRGARRPAGRVAHRRPHRRRARPAAHLPRGGARPARCRAAGAWRPARSPPASRTPRRRACSPRRSAGDAAAARPRRARAPRRTRRRRWAVIEALVRYAPRRAAASCWSAAARSRSSSCATCAIGRGRPSLGEAELAFTPDGGGGGARARRRATASTRQRRRGDRRLGDRRAVRGLALGRARRRASAARPIRCTATSSSHILAPARRRRPRLPRGRRRCSTRSRPRAPRRSGSRRAGERLARAARAHLPVTWARGPRLHALPPALPRVPARAAGAPRADEELRALRLAHGALLRAEGHTRRRSRSCCSPARPSEALAAAERAIRA